MRKALFVLLFIMVAENAYANIPATPREQFIGAPIKSFYHLSLREREVRGKWLYAQAITYLVQRMRDADDARDKAIFTTIVEQPGKVRALISVEESSVMFYGTYTDPLSGNERQFGYMLKLLLKQK